MQKIKTATFIGSGNVATHLAQVLFDNGVSIQQICSRLMRNAEILATKVNAEAIDHIDDIDENVDLIFCCTKDDLILKITKKIAQKKKIKNMVHTSGTVGLEVFKDTYKLYDAVGIFYPLQTFSKSNAVDFSIIPIGITTQNKNLENNLFALASTISNKPFVIADEDRKHLHLSAVLVNNFVNHLFAIAQHYCKENNLNFDLLKPLIHQTISKIDTVPAIDAQTGPAKRNDQDIIKKHLEMLNNDVLTKNIYQALTDSILSMYHKQ
jgi:predicted short-subunit dehydrogenase-like oxidoreductase (DUF2520 family)